MKALMLFFKLGFGRFVSDNDILCLKDATNSKDVSVFLLNSNDLKKLSSDIKVSIFVVRIVQTINNTKLYGKLKVKVAEFEQTLVELKSAKKEIQILKEDMGSCL